ncbi:peptidase domain-containing ABC transporter [Sorangium sp. So ce204]|uniref:peptidase domain-containing ABC transporter n=1 Tax=Sorangium sp. So ce204 TaxID=3133288 RepID=UPI003F600B27
MTAAGDTGGLAARLPAFKRLRMTARPRRIPFVQQLTDTECGVACLAMVLAYLGKSVGREEVRAVLAAGRDGTSARKIVQAAQHFGLRARAVKLKLEALAHLAPGAILHWDFNHFVVFERLGGRGVDIVDPAVGGRRVPLEEASRLFTGVALVFEPSERFEPRAAAKGRRPVHQVLLASGSWARIFTTSFFLQLLALAFPLLTGAVVDRVVPRADRHLLLVVSVGLASIVCFHFLASMVRSHLLLKLRAIFDARMTASFLDHLISLSYAFFQRRSAGDLMMRLNSNTTIREILTAGVLSALLDGAMVLLYLFLLLLVSATLGAVVIALGALQIAAVLLVRPKQKEINAALLTKQARLQGYQIEMLAGMETLKGMGCEQRAEVHWSDLFVEVLNTSLRSGRLSALSESVSATVSMGAPLIVLLIGASQVLSGALSLGSMLALNTFAVGLLNPLSSLVATAAQLQLLDGYAERIDEVIRAPVEQEPTAARAPHQLRGAIELDRVSFRYGPLEPLVVDDVSVRVAPGQLVAIVGRSGSGKSTLASLLLGLYAPSSGRVLYDGANLRELELRSVRRQLGIVSQRPYLFGTSIRDNIAFSDPDLPFEAVQRAAERAQIHDEIAKMPMGYETLLLDGGGSLSGGQRQRVALARALVREPAILLLDEATSALDAITERKVQEQLASLRCTRVVIAHRLSTIRDADVILVMDQGRLVERGTHAELLVQQGLYAELIAGQLAAHEEVI